MIIISVTFLMDSSCILRTCNIYRNENKKKLDLIKVIQLSNLVLNSIKYIITRLKWKYLLYHVWFYFLFHLYPTRINQFQLLINLPLRSGYMCISHEFTIHFMQGSIMLPLSKRRSNRRAGNALETNYVKRVNCFIYHSKQWNNMKHRSLFIDGET